MIKSIHTRISRHSLKLVVATLFLGIAGLAFASMGGEKRNKKSGSVRSEFVPIKTSAGFTLKTGSSYKGSMILNQEKSNGQIRFNSLVTFQKGNTTYILPLNHRINMGSLSTTDNTQMLRLKVRMHK
ncbi:hypothetical protein [Flavihumibacter fluvii]|uniref:hypothetical protein n=1 Tax=Flavihumibacter fluvii TaxID=2838157 RepID=UPI001BDDDABB|nr:hypothetical protein [Flavihumibacter fluvii]ULQ54556.1 hypothetical protein KJS93_09510 [Flavihumibacter fluvii]